MEKRAYRDMRYAKTPSNTKKWGISTYENRILPATEKMGKGSGILWVGGYPRSSRPYIDFGFF